MNKQRDTRVWIVLQLVLLAVFILPSVALAHGIAGKRFFPTTFLVDDPFISDEFSVLLNRIKGPGAPAPRLTAIDIDYSKRLVSNFGIELHEAYQRIGFEGDGSASGWDNLGLGLKWQFLTSEEHETILSVGADFDIGGTGGRRIAESFSTVTPALFLGKGLGDLPPSLNFFRPFAITGAVGVGFPTRRANVTVNPDGSTDMERNPTVLNWGVTLQYSLMYLQSFVKDIGLGSPFNRMIIVTEFPMQTDLSVNKGRTVGTVNPGIVWCGKFVELGVAAEIPINRNSGRNAGFIGLIHLFMDDLFPKSLGRPLLH